MSAGRPEMETGLTAVKARMLLDHFVAIATTARANWIGDVAYIVINDEERQRFPCLEGYFGIAIEGQIDNQTLRYTLFRTESSFDDDVLAALAICGEHVSLRVTRLQ